MRHGVTLPNCGLHGDPHVMVDLAVEAERAGWDGVFLWDTLYENFEAQPTYAADAWITLTAIAMRTERIVLGTMVTALAWQRPWRLARQASTLDHVSKGRFVLPVGLGAVPDEGLVMDEPTDRRERAAIMDETLDVLIGLWSGRPFSYDGKYHRVREVTFVPPPVQRPRIPIWVVGAWPTDPSMWPKRKSMRRALRYDGVLPNFFESQGKFTEGSSDDLRAMCDWIRNERADGPFDVICEASTKDAADPAERIRPWAEAGATWWLEPVWEELYRDAVDPEPIRERIKRGPPDLG